jgi:hypothetical protein
MVVAIVDEAAVDLVEGAIKITYTGADASGLEIGGIGPSLVPRGFPEEFVRLIGAELILEAEGEVVDGLAVVRVGVAALQHLDSSAQVGLGLVEAATTQVPKTYLIVATVVQGVATQGLLVIVESRPCGVAILLKVQACKVKLVDGLDLLGAQRGLSSIGDGAYIVGLGLPSQHGMYAVRVGYIGAREVYGEFVDAVSLQIDDLIEEHFG